MFPKGNHRLTAVNCHFHFVATSRVFPLRGHRRRRRKNPRKKVSFTLFAVARRVGCRSNERVCVLFRESAQVKCRKKEERVSSFYASDFLSVPIGAATATHSQDENLDLRAHIQPPVGNRGPGGLAQVPQPNQHGRHRHRRRRAARRGRCPAHAPAGQLQVVLPAVGPEADRIPERVLRQRAVHGGSGQAADDAEDDQPDLRELPVGVRNAQLRSASDGPGQDAAQAGGHRPGGGRAAEPIHGGRAHEEHQHQCRQGAARTRVGDRKDQLGGERTGHLGRDQHERDPHPDEKVPRRHHGPGPEKHGRAERDRPEDPHIVTSAARRRLHPHQQQQQQLVLLKSATKTVHDPRFLLLLQLPLLQRHHHRHRLHLLLELVQSRQALRPDFDSKNFGFCHLSHSLSLSVCLLVNLFSQIATSYLFLYSLPIY